MTSCLKMKTGKRGAESEAGQRNLPNVLSPKNQVSQSKMKTEESFRSSLKVQKKILEDRKVRVQKNLVKM